MMHNIVINLNHLILGKAHILSYSSCIVIFLGENRHQTKTIYTQYLIVKNILLKIKLLTLIFLTVKFILHDPDYLVAC